MSQEFFREVLREFRLVHWPTRAEVLNSTVVVVIMVFVLAFFMGAVDVACRGSSDEGPAMSGRDGAAAGRDARAVVRVHTYSGFENKVAEAIRRGPRSSAWTRRSAGSWCPPRRSRDPRAGRSARREQKFFPGYVLVEMDLTDDTWHLVQARRRR